MNILIALLVAVVIGLIAGIMLALASHFFKVEENETVKAVRECLPGANCGGCGFPGCGGFATALVEGGATKVSACVVSNAETRQNIVAYLNETPGPDGTCVKVTI